jgi:nucleoside-diphosphate-sugar epimerase
MSARDVVLVTGAGGFIGRSVVRCLQRRGEGVVALVQDDDQRGAVPAGAGIEVVAGDLCDAGGLARALSGVVPRAVIHLAGRRVTGTSDDDRENARLNVDPTVGLVAGLDRSALEALVFASSGEVYGPRAGLFVETAAPRPMTAYARAKLAAEQHLMAAHHADGLPVVVARLAVAYGPGQPGTMLIPSLMEAARTGRPVRMTAGEQTRDFVYVDDVAEALVRLTHAPRAIGRIVNVGSGLATPIRELAQTLAASLHGRLVVELGAIPYRNGEQMEYCFDTALLKELTGYVPDTVLADGLAQVVAAEPLFKTA